MKDIKKYQICSRCIMDTSDPDIKFDESGICNHCTNAKKLLETKWFPNEIGEKKLFEISEKIRNYGEKKAYDSIIGISGGVDSSYLLHIAVDVMKLRPLVFHVDAGWNSEIAVKNIETMTNKLGLDLETYVVNWNEIRDLQLSFLKSSVENQDIPQDHVFFAKLYEYAIKNRIKYVLTGSNLTSESILPSSWGYDATDKKHLLAIHKLFGSVKLKTYPTMSFFEYRILWPLIYRMEIVRPLNYINYDKNKAIEYLETHYGWRYYGGKHHESRWTRFFQSYYLPKKFGFDKRRAHLSSLIAAGQMTREAALAEMEKEEYSKEKIDEDKKYIAEKLGISEDEFSKLLELDNKSYTNYPNSEKQLNILRLILTVLKRIKNFVK